MEDKGGKSDRGVDNPLNVESMYRRDKKERKKKDDGKRGESRHLPVVFPFLVPVKHHDGIKKQVSTKDLRIETWASLH